LWETRTWGWISADASQSIPTLGRRIGTVWTLIQEIEDSLSEAEQGDLWSSAAAVYPELQDWVARRGHGGAAHWSLSKTPDDIAALADQVDFLVVQLHMGFQFSEAPADAARKAAHASVTAGADLVVLHHPHVLQGLEWVDGVPVVYSMGNLIFDQNFLSTFGSGVLRVVVDGGGEVEQVRFIPVWLDDYIPAVVTGHLGRRVLQQMWERSVQKRTAVRTSSGEIVPMATDPTSPEASVAGHVRWEHNTIRFLEEPTEPRTRGLELKGGQAVPVPEGWLIQTPLPDGAGLEVGRSLLGLGHFEDEDTDPRSQELVGWKVYGSDAHRTDEDAQDGIAALELVARPDRERTTARMLARAPIPAHRVYDTDGEPLDAEARYSIRMRAWAAQETDRGLVRVALYNFDDTDPSAAPVSTLVKESALSFRLPSEEWTTVELDIPPADLTNADGLRANFALVYLSATQADRRSSVLRVDDVELIEWRSASSGTGVWERIDYLTGGYGSVELETLSWSAP